MKLFHKKIPNRRMQNQLLNDRMMSLVLDAVSDHTDSESITQALKTTDSVAKLFRMTTTGCSKQNKELMRDCEIHLKELESSRYDLDPSKILQTVREAETGRLAKLEHETMAKLVNKMCGRTELIEAFTSSQSSINDMSEYSETLHQRISQRQLVARILSQLIPSVQASLSEMPSPENLPPLDEIDPSLFIIE
jgi:hypothetical protein